MAQLDLHYLGSFQKGTRLTTENPTEEVWSRLSLHGSLDYLHDALKVTKLPKDKAAKYVAMRMRQATEFRGAYRGATLLTAPLTLYYAFLNLTRACLAIQAETISTAAHGLRFTRKPKILECQAQLKLGTFTDYLTANSVNWNSDTAISLDDCISRIIETGTEYFEVGGKPPLAVPIAVKAMRTGKTLFHFNEEWSGGKDHFRERWQSEYPSLIGHCSLEAEGCTLRIHEAEEPNSLDEVSNLCNRLLEVNLIWSDIPMWFTIRRTNSGLVWPRPAYYLAALFILSSLVRYEPDLLFEEISQNSKWVWFFKRFLEKAERFFPHLMFNWIHNGVHFFG